MVISSDAHIPNSNPPTEETERCNDGDIAVSSIRVEPELSLTSQVARMLSSTL